MRIEAITIKKTVLEISPSRWEHVSTFQLPTFAFLCNLIMPYHGIGTDTHHIHIGQLLIHIIIEFCVLKLLQSRIDTP